MKGKKKGISGAPLLRRLIARLNASVSETRCTNKIESGEEEGNEYTQLADTHPRCPLLMCHACRLTRFHPRPVSRIPLPQLSFGGLSGYALISVTLYKLVCTLEEKCPLTWVMRLKHLTLPSVTRL